MRRALVLTAVFGSFLAGLGCRNVTTGRCDCTNDPVGTALPPAVNPYPVVGAPTSTGPASPITMPTAPDKLPATGK
ncbi:hypothetical protein [Fimbriiglobus ruber]|uniref:Lipoprotein n=1 Tax=Fimbriiglobus ruber TaxID=1908690 RepID=A0A225DAR2_9BACT|nr:hypothetical protein [Fimbriiglobus ruber]OWK34386.1 hypothetical protein FRUB_10357 [Fimbriiglobus ruber]